jgi:hypothetical protein
VPLHLPRIPWIIAAAVVLVRILTILPFPPVIVPDSARYRWPANPIEAFDVWIGKGPGVLDQLLFMLPGHWGEIAQVIVSGALWSASAVLLYRLSRRYRRTVFALMMAASLNPWSSIWDAWYLTEAVTIAGCVAAAIGCVAFAVTSRDRVPALGLAIAGGSAAILARPYAAPLVLPLLALALLLPPVWRRGLTKRVLLVGGAVLAVVSLFAVWQVIEFEYVAEGGHIVQVRAAERLGLRSADVGYLQAAKAHGMPSCPALEAALTDPAMAAERLNLARHSTCPGYQAWLQRGGLSWESELIDAPAGTLAAFINPHYWLDGSVLQYVPLDPRGHWLTDNAPSLVTPISHAVNLVTYIVGAVSLVLAMIVVLLTRRRVVIIFAALTLAWVAAFVFIAWADDGIENWRHVLPGLYVIGPICWALLALVSSSRPAPAKPLATLS